SPSRWCRPRLPISAAATHATSAYCSSSIRWSSFACWRSRTTTSQRAIRRKALRPPARPHDRCGGRHENVAGTYPERPAARNTGTSQLEKGAAIDMKRMTFGLAVLLTGLGSGAIRGQTKYPSIDAYLMPRDAEIALARTAAPANISDRATIKVLTKSGYEVAREGDN